MEQEALATEVLISKLMVAVGSPPMEGVVKGAAPTLASGGDNVARGWDRVGL